MVVFNATREALAVYDDLVEVSYRKQCNTIGMAVLTVPEGHPILDLLEDDMVINIYLGVPDSNSMSSPGNYIWRQHWVFDYEGLYRDRQITTDADGNIYYLLFFPSMMEILSRYIVAWPAGVDFRSIFHTYPMAQTLNMVIRRNCTSEATAASGRLRTATVIRNLAYTGHASGSAIASYTAGTRNVLELMQELAPLCNFDFDVVPEWTFPGNYIFKQYAGQLGTDKSATVVFDLALDNLGAANMYGDRLREKTVAIVGGAGTGEDRTYVIRTGDNYSATNDYEVFVDASTETDTATLEDLGDARLGELKATAKINASIIASLGYVYRQHYNHGDLVTVQIGDVSVVRKIDAVDVTFSQNQRVDVRLEFANP